MTDWKKQDFLNEAFAELDPPATDEIYVNPKGLVVMNLVTFGKYQDAIEAAEIRAGRKGEE